MLDAESFELLLRQNRSNWCCRFHVIASDGWFGLEQEEDLKMRNLVAGFFFLKVSRVSCTCSVVLKLVNSAFFKAISLKTSQMAMFVC